MARIQIENDQLVVQLDGIAWLVHLRERVAVSLAHIVSVEARAEPPRNLIEHLEKLTNPGTYLPGLVQVGTFIAKDGLVFYALRDSRRAVVIELTGERYRRLIVEPPRDETPEACAHRIQQAVSRARDKPPLA